MFIFEKAFTHTLGIEGSYSNNPNDTGGETMWGITKALAVHYGYSGNQAVTASTKWAMTTRWNFKSKN